MAFEPSPAWFRKLAESLRDVVFRYRVADPKGTDYVSPQVFALLGRTAEEFYADPDLPLKCVHPDERHVIEGLFRGDAPTIPELLVLRWCHADQRTVTVEFRNAAVTDANGRLIAIEGVARDMTDNLAVQNRLRESEHQLRQLAASVEDAREKEREHVARELHDELGQSLTALKFELARTARALIKAGVDHESIEGLQAIVGGVEVANETVRRLATSLRPPALDHLGLVAAIELEAAALSRRTGIRCRVAGNRRVGALDPAQRTCVFRIVQEALTNVVRHASASAINIRIDEAAGALRVKVQDNGRGITDAQLDSPSAIGLLGMRERAELIGATLTIGSRPGKGTEVLLTLARSAAADGVVAS
ncbi:MAG: PAS domain-containing protein [Acidobacteria bacterium]|nr:PAS domain-containing protein [Acidobacteriota bacterium]